MIVASGTLASGGGGSNSANLSSGLVMSDASGASPLEAGRQYAQQTSFRINLYEEEAAGGHTISSHVGQSDYAMTRRLEEETYTTGNITAAALTVGTFTSVYAAEKLVNATLSQNASIVAQVATGARSYSYISSGPYDVPTGREAYRASIRQSPQFRETYMVGVFIVRDPRSPNGFNVRTAYPTSQ